MQCLRRVAHCFAWLFGHVHQETPDPGFHLFAPNGRGWRYGTGAYVTWPEGPPPTAESGTRRAAKQGERHNPISH
jgi:hypothetical protein